jgi:murein DD-endopeptidase MepM/ murein hydrolase activator NlpD
VEKLTRSFSDPYVVGVGCAVGVVLAVLVLLTAGPAFATEGGGSSADEPTTQTGSSDSGDADDSTQRSSTTRTPATAYPSGFGRRLLRRGARGVDVRYLQSLLGRLGYRTSVDGQFGRGTERRVKAWERSVKGRVDGRVPPGQAKEMMRRAGSGDSATAVQPRSAPSGGAGKYVFPIRGRHTYGTSINRYGAGRSGHSHGGQDVFAAAGTTLVAVTAGRVYATGSGGGAGNYVVISGDDKLDYAYYHMQSSAIVRKGQRVSPGTPVGRVGCTGSCSGDHLHFEIWTAHWWNGGHNFDPLPTLKEWDSYS